MFSPFCRISDSKIDCVRGTLKPVHSVSVTMERKSKKLLETSECLRVSREVEVLARPCHGPTWG